MRRTLLALGGVILMLATACGSPTRANTPTNSGTAATTTTTASAAQPATTVPTVTPTTAPDTTVIPDHITVAYVDAVLAQLNHVYGDAVRTSVKARKVTAQTRNDLASIYTSRLESEEIGIFQQGATVERRKLRPVPGDPITSVDKLIYASRSCVYMKVQTNSNPLVIRPVAPFADEYMGLQHPTTIGHSSPNRTPWIFFFDLVNDTPTNVPNQCPNA